MLIHILHVKNGQCVIIEHEKRTTMIDIHKLSESDRNEEILEAASMFQKETAGGYVYKATNPIDYWKSRIGGSAFRIIITHPDHDHVRGFKEFYENISTTNLWMPTSHIDTIPNTDDGDLIKNIVNGNVDGVTFIEPKRGSNNMYFGTGESDWDQIQILHPASSYVAESSNQGSYLIKINYGESSIIIGGDTEKETFEWLYEKYPEELKCTVFIASHHGRQSGWPGKELIQHMNPLMVVIPKGKILPKDSALGNYRNALGSERFITTSYAGNVRIKLNKYDEVDLFECERTHVNDQLPSMVAKARVLRKNGNLEKIIYNYLILK
jgi:beta-lactamase superfamily II metal-dependent hydrolase